MSKRESSSWRCPDCRYRWKTLADEPPTECPSCGFVDGGKKEEEGEEKDED